MVSFYAFPEIKTHILNIYFFSERAPQSKGGCTDTLDTPPGSATGLVARTTNDMIVAINITNGPIPTFWQLFHNLSRCGFTDNYSDKIKLEVYKREKA